VFTAKTPPLGSPKKNTSLSASSALEEKLQKSPQRTRTAPKGQLTEKRLFGIMRGLGYNIKEDWVRSFFTSVFDSF
jgi:hypothetical protein